jgi:hypothetical protein
VCEDDASIVRGFAVAAGLQFRRCFQDVLSLG